MGFVVLAAGLLVVAGGIWLLIRGIRARHVVWGVAGAAAVVASGISTQSPESMNA